MRYTFGHTIEAAERLHKIAEFFNPSAHHFIKQNIQKDIHSALDLGCGPGYSTEMLANASGAGEVRGIDISQNFIQIAAEQYPQMDFQRGDVTRLHLSHKYDLMYSRFLFSHLTDISSVVQHWIAHLNKEGLLFIEELELIDTHAPVCRRYLHLNETNIESEDAEIFTEKVWDDFPGKFKVIINRSEVIPVSDSVAAAWLHPGSAGAGDEGDFVSDILDESDRIDIARTMLNMQQSDGQKSSITWKIKRLVLTI